jgi:deaminated glutathione amidase
MRAALLQLCAGDDPVENLPVAEAMVREAAAEGAELVATPECTNMITFSRSLQTERLRTELEDTTLSRLRAVADELGIWLLIGSLCLKSGKEGDPRFVNRSVLVAPDGSLQARYDKIHMFDVELGEGGSYRESAAFCPGDAAVVAEAAGMRIGMTVCYDLRFPHLYRDLAKAGAQVLTVPSAFTVPTGKAHWHALLRARAIETGAYVLAPAQCGTHAASRGRTRETYGHSLAISPWGEVIADAGDTPETIVYADLDPAAVEEARACIPALIHDRAYAAAGDR